MHFTIAAITALFLIFCNQSMASEIIINAVGDVMLSDRWASQLKKPDYDFPFKNVTAELAAGDITLANLESPIACGGERFTDKKFHFRAETEVARALGNARINVVTLANNHIMDFGRAALTETIQNLDNEQIAHCGAGKNIAAARKPAIVSVQGKKVAFLGYSLTRPGAFFAATDQPGTAPGLEAFYQTDIRKARREADVVIVSFHWGSEGKNTAQPYQQLAARKAIDAGADVIIGHHPHVLQGVERYREGIIFYSLGNFIFASKSKTADTSAIIRLRIGRNGREAEIIPVDVQHRRVGFQPQLLTGHRAAEVVRQLNALSNKYGTQINQIDGRFVVKF